jgi:hypothetical protein
MRGSTVDTVERLKAIEEIKQLKARYFRCMDTKDWDGYAQVFAPHAVLDVTGESRVPDDEGIIRGNTAIAAYVRGQVDPVTTVHHGHMPEIALTGPDTARGIWAMEDYVEFPPGADGARVGLRGYGHYHEEYRRDTDGQWRIARLHLSRLRIDPL